MPAMICQSFCNSFMHLSRRCMWIDSRRQSLQDIMPRNFTAVHLHMSWRIVTSNEFCSSRRPFPFVTIIRYIFKFKDRAHGNLYSGSHGNTFGDVGRRAVSTSAPVSVTSSVCSNWALLPPSSVTAVHPSGHIRSRHTPGGRRRDAVCSSYSHGATFSGYFVWSRLYADSDKPYRHIDGG